MFSERYGLDLYYNVVTGHWPRRPGFDASWCETLVDQVAVIQVILRIVGFSLWVFFYQWVMIIFTTISSLSKLQISKSGNIWILQWSFK